MSVITRLPAAKSLAPLFLAMGLYAAALMLVLSRPKLSLVVLVLLSAALTLAAPFVAWRSLHVAIVLVILFIPIGRYTFSVNLPFDLEPYRVMIGVILVLWAASLLVDRRVRLRATGYEAPILLVVLATFASDAANPHTVAAVQENVLKGLIFFASFVLFYYFATSTIRTWDDIDRILKVTVVGSSALALFGLIEYRTGWTPFNDFARVFPFLSYTPLPFNPHDASRGSHVRAMASAAHSIAFGALMVMMLPLTIYLVRKYGRRWLVATVLLSLGSVSAISRTPVTMLAAVAIMIVWLRPHTIRVDFKRVIVGLAVVLVIIKVAAPGAVGSIRYQFSPQEGLIASQQSSKGSEVSGGRLTDIGPVLRNVAEHPLFGSGYATRLVGRNSAGEYQKGRILDDQWLGNLNDTGVIGFAAWVWLFYRFMRRLRSAARTTRGDEGWLIVGLAASVFALMVGMLTFDAFGFTQETFILFMLLALAALLTGPQELRPQRALVAPHRSP
jgi:hypothetical protein